MSKAIIRAECQRCRRVFKEEVRVHCELPVKYFIDVFYKGERFKICCTKKGERIRTLEDARAIKGFIDTEIYYHEFDRTKYKRQIQKEFIFQNAYGRWLNVQRERLLRQNISPHTYDQFLRYRSHLESYFSLMDVREIRAYHLEEFWQKHLPKSYSPKTVKNILGILSSFFSYLLRREMIEKKPLFPRIEVNEPSWRWIDEKTQDRIIGNIPENDRPIFIFMRRTGVRQGEARAMQVEDFLWDKEVIIISKSISKGTLKHTKTKNIRILPVHPEFEKWIKPLCKGKFPKAFVLLKNGRPYAPTTLRRIWDAACKKVGVKIDLMSATRHSLASQAVQRGVPIQFVKEKLGHSSIKSSERYAHLDIVSLILPLEG